MGKNGFWSPYVSGIGLGFTLLVTFYVMGKGLGASSAFSIASAVVTQKVSPDYAGSLKYFSRYLGGGSPLKDWIVFEIIGLFVGAVTGSLLSRSFRLKFDKPSHATGGARFFTALTGGALLGFAARLARGCTSGIALTGGAQLALAGWVFVISMFVTGFIVAAVFRRMWA
jgi:uncharacterized membrane protein YedE/YeeE